MAVAAVLVVGGCTKDDPTPPTTSSTSVGSGTTSSPATSSSPPTTSATATPTYPVDLPDAAKAHTREGAIAMARYFVQVADEAAMANDVERLQAISDAGCVGCSKLVQQTQDNKAKGIHQRDPGLRVEAVLPAIPDQSNKPQQQVDMVTKTAATKYVRSDGTVEVSYPATGYNLRVVLSWGAQGWIIVQAGAVTF